MRVSRVSLFAISILLILANGFVTPNSIMVDFQTNQERDGISVISEDSYFFDRNWSIQVVFVGFNESTINQTQILELLPAWNDINYTAEAIRHWLDYDFAFADSEYELALKDVLLSNSNETAIGTAFNQTLFQNYLNGTGDADAAFSQRSGTAIDGAAIETWLEDNPYAQSGNTWNLYLLNLTEIDSYNHTQEHWYSYSTADHDTGKEIDWLTLKNGAIVYDISFQYVGAAGQGRNVLLDPSANQWYLHYCMTEYNSTLASNESWPLFMSKDLDDIQRLYDLDTAEGVNNLSMYLAEYSSGIISNLFVPGTSPNSGGLNPPTWFNPLLDAVEMQIDVFVIDDDVEPNSLSWSLDEYYLHELFAAALPFPTFNLTASFSRIEDDPGYEALFWRNAVTIGDHTFVNATDLIRDLEISFPPAQSWSTTRLQGIVFLMSNMTMRTSYANVTSIFSGYMFAMCRSIEAIFGAHETLPMTGLTSEMVETASHLFGLNASSFMHNYVADYGRGAASRMIRSGEMSLFEANTIRMMYLDHLEIQLLTDFADKDAAFPDQATSATSRARESALYEFSLADNAISNWSWEQAYAHLLLARDWTKRMWWSKLDTTRPTISGWGLEGNYSGGEPYRAWASVEDMLSGIENVSAYLRNPNDFITKHLLASNGTHWVVDLPGFSMNGTYQLWIVSYDWGMNVATSYRQTIEYSSVVPRTVDPSETLLVVVVSSALFAALTISLSFIYDRRRKAISQ